MGVNFTSLNKTIHYGAPSTIEDYFQESGRVGRSGEQGKSIVFWKPSDAPNYKDTSKPRHAELAAVRGYLENTEECRRCQLLYYFDPELIGLLPPRDLMLCCDVCARSVTTSSNWTLKLNIEKGYLLLTWVQKIACQCFDWMLQSSSGQKWKKCKTTLLFIAIHYWGYTSSEVKDRWGLLLPFCLLITAVQQPETSRLKRSFVGIIWTAPVLCRGPVRWSRN